MRNPFLAFVLFAFALATNGCSRQDANGPREFPREKEDRPENAKPSIETASPIGELDTKIRNGRTFVAVSADGALLVSRSMQDTNNVQFWDPAKRAKMKELSLDTLDFTLSMTRDGKLAACVRDPFVLLFRTADGTSTQHWLEGEGFPFPELGHVLSKSGETLFVVDARRIVCLDVATGKQRAMSDTSAEQGPRLCGLSPTFDNNRKIASGDDDGDIKIWDIAAGKVVQSLKRAEEAPALRVIAVTEDGKTMISLGIFSPAACGTCRRGRFVGRSRMSAAGVASSFSRTSVRCCIRRERSCFPVRTRSSKTTSTWRT